MKHLSEEALVDLAEGGKTGLDHLENCAVCRARVQTMRHTMGVLQADRVPEPSPLFWGHLSDRINRAVVGEATPKAADWLRALGDRLWAVQRLRWSWGLATVAAIMIAAFIMSPLRSPGPVTGRSAANSSPLPGQANAAAEDLGWASAAADESWQIVEGAAADLDLEAVGDAGIFVRAGSIDRELLMLSDQERRDLAGAIRIELDRSRL